MAEPDNKGLEADIGITLGKLQKQLAAAEARMVKAAKRGEAAFKKANRGVSRSFNELDRASKSVARGASGATNGLRQMSLQLSQVGQQGAATGNYLQALAIQLPDLALGFGTFGILAGAAAGSLLSMSGSLLESADSAEELESAIKSLQSLSSDLRDTLRLVTSDVSDLSDEYGEAALRVLRFGVAQAESRVGAANARLSEQVSILDDIVAQYITSSTEGSRYEAVLARITESFGVAGEAAVTLEGLLQNLFLADNFQAQQAALGEILELLSEMGVSLSEIPEDIRIAIDEYITLSNETDAARKLAEDLALATAEIAPSLEPGVTQATALKNELADALALQNRIFQQESLVYSGRGQDPRRFEDGGDLADYESRLGYETPDDVIARYTPKTRRSSARAPEPQTEKLSEELRELLRAVERSSNEFDDFFSDIVRNSETAAEAVSRLADTLLDDLLRNAISPVSDALGGIFTSFLKGGFSGFGVAPTSGAGFASVLPSFDGGGFTGSGSRSGGIDGKGGFAAVLHPNETVIDHTKGRMGAMSISQSFHINGTNMSADEVAARLAPMMEAKAAQVFTRARREGR
ncbi:hypothetical protein [uncultured Roseobacter sp.]|uniref:hypothetical protein n=1 Tax=uncultured Roseobacter sp. TaxID=114847 RepID=UPI0026227016|nr:hypothetical protein [uncultured Roseobacter sp.]